MSMSSTNTDCLNRRSAQNHNIKYLILIPAYNAAVYLAELVSRVKKSISGADILIINDGSTDRTSELLPTLDVISLSNQVNQGKGYSLNRGFRYAIENNYDYCITIDADLQHLPEELPLFPAESGRLDICLGTREISLKSMPPARWLTNNLTSLIISILSGCRIRDSQSGYRMMATDLLENLKIKSMKYDFESELLLQAGA
ncbi:MAG: glycosyltransferase family 2 protein, partial [candidate division Zixibacteria bacterium]|nr:glycosyltransferase family 2 protein [candidate division Zixibacteria bacterium]